MHPDDVLAPPVPLREWAPLLPPGDVRGITLHWTAGDYGTVFAAYHFCIAGASEPVVHHTFDLRANMRELRYGANRYAAHVAGRNSWQLGIAVCAMRDAQPHDFGPAPITAVQIDALCRVAAYVGAFYRLPVEAIGTHAEAAVTDGYFGAGDDERWDIARLRPSRTPLAAAEAGETGEALRARIALYYPG